MFPLFALQTFEWAQKFAHWFNFFINLHCETITFYGTVNEHTTQEGPSKHELPRGIGRETQTQSVENGGWGLSCWVVQREMFWTLHGHWRVVIQGEAVQRGFWELCIWGLWQTMSNWLEVVDMGHKKLFKGLIWETKRLFLEDCKSIVLKSCDKWQTMFNLRGCWRGRQGIVRIIF